MSKNFEKEYKESISRAKKILGNCDEPIDTNVKEAIEAIFPILKDKTDEQKWKILKSMIHSNVPDNIYSYYKLGRGDFESWLDDKSKEILVLKDQIESLTAVLKLFNESKHKPVVSREVIKDGIAHFGITQHQIDNWLKKYFNIIDQDPCEDCKHPMLNCHNFPCMEKIAFSKGKTIYEVTKPEQLNGQEKVNCNAGPVFHEGDWVVKGNVIAQILDVQEQYYIGLDTEGNDFTSSRFLSDDKIHLWSIQDARDGDVLVDIHGNIGIFEKRYGCNWHTYCYLGNKGLLVSEGGSHGSVCYPATKEQRDALERAITNAGYEWDAEKKKLEKIENKKPLLSDFFKAEYERGKANAQKPAWSEEDENVLKDIKTAVTSYWSEDVEDAILDWLKSLKDRYTWKPNEEQLIALNNAVLLNEDHYNGAVLSTLLEQLKKL